MRSLEEPDENWDAEWEDIPPFACCPECDAKYIFGDKVTYFGGGYSVRYICCYCEDVNDCTDAYMATIEPDPDRYRDEERDIRWDMEDCWEEY